MSERLTNQVGVRQRDRHAKAGEADPRGQVLGAVWHQQRHHISGSQPLRMAPAGILAAAIRQLRVTQRRLR